MQVVDYRLRLNLLTNGSQGSIRVKRGENGARRLIVSLYTGSSPYIPGTDVTAVFRAKKPDSVCLYNDATINDNTVTVDLTTQTVASAGAVTCELSLYGTNNELLYSPQFDVIVEDYLYSDNEVESTSEYTALTAAISMVTDIKNSEAARADAEATRVAAETARETAEAERVTAEEGRVAAEAARVTAEEARATAETARIAEADAIITRNEAIADAEAVRVQSEKQRQSAERLRLSAENGRSAEESRRRSAESERVNEFDGIVSDFAAIKSQEEGYATAEAARVAAENERVTCEELRNKEITKIGLVAEEAYTTASAVSSKTGDLSDLTTTDKSTLVAAINEAAKSGLPTVTAADDGKVLAVENGAWAVAEIPSASGVSF